MDILTFSALTIEMLYSNDYWVPMFFFEFFNYKLRNNENQQNKSKAFYYF